ncbi:GMP synthase [Halopseudomonas oceani]|uniref:GMP synthase n=1 Tax=Halopseudomonas oceani TaxID=1708783 RepID=A0A2P4EV58_9GAMM|nr:GMP synthase [Halopseudomonas oceani]POB03466.1 GMP synthase [Halopseudomonas oceani]GGE44621.1 GMP synthase [Halopseudomonas oceani]
MKVGLLQCDDVNESLLPAHGNYPEMFELALRKRLPQMDYRIYPAHKSELPGDPHECDVYLITGSKHGVYEEQEWIRELERFITQLWDLRKPLIGVCFGHQVMATAMGGQVEKSDRGWGVGVSFNQILEPKPWMQPVQDKLDLIVSHQDQVVELPPQAQVVASSDFCPNYLLQYGSHFLSVQGHPEFEKGYSEALMDMRSLTIPPARVRAGKVSLHADLDSDLMFDWIINFLRQAQG